MDMALWATFTMWLVMTIRVATPLIYTALGGMIGQKAGVFNFALEGSMLLGAFFAYIGSSSLGSPWFGLVFAILAGLFVGLIYAFTSVHLAVSQMVIGLGINILALGITGYFYRLLDTSVVAPMFGVWHVPLLSRIPFVGEVFFSHTGMVYVAVLLVFLFFVFLHRTTLGLEMRSVGENPRAADSLGISVFRYRYVATMISCGLAATGGAFLTLTQVSRFLENMIEGRGWIALAAIILGKYEPKGILLACLLFGGAEALAMQLQILGIAVPYQALQMIPYALTMVVLGGVVGRIKGPAALAKPFIK